MFLRCIFCFIILFSALAMAAPSDSLFASSANFHTTAALAVPSAIDYQATIYNAQGNPLDGSISITFSIWDDQLAGTMLWSENQTIYVRDGLITAELGLIKPFTETMFNRANRFLQVSIQGEDLKPRKLLVSVPFAFFSQNTKMFNGNTVDGFYTRTQADNASQNHIDAEKLGGLDYSQYLTVSLSDARYVQKYSIGSVTSDMIIDGSIQPKDLGFNIGNGSIAAIVAGEGLLTNSQNGIVSLSLLPGLLSGSFYNDIFVRRNQSSVITNPMIVDENITTAKIKDGTLLPQDFGFTVGSITGINPGVGLAGGGTNGTISLSLNDSYMTGAAYDSRFIKLNAKSIINSDMIRNNEIKSEDIMNGTIQQEDMAFAYGDITSIKVNNGLSGGGEYGDVVLGLDPRFVSGEQYDGRFVNVAEKNSINSDMIVNGSIKQEDMSFNAGDITGVYTTGGIVGGNSSGEIHLQLAAQYLSGSVFDGNFVNEGQNESISSAMVQNGSIQTEDLDDGIITAEKLSDNFFLQKSVDGRGVISAQNYSSSAISSGLWGKGYLGVQGFGTSIGVYGEGAQRGLYGRCTTSTGYGLFVEGRAHCTSGGWGDLAEFVPSEDRLEPGDVVIINPNAANELMRCSKKEDTRVAGIVSTEPTITVGLEELADGRYPLALAGIVPCKIACDQPIQPGDLLTSSEVPGCATKADNPKIGTIIGKAMEPFAGGTGKIRVLVTLQ